MKKKFLNATALCLSMASTTCMFSYASAATDDLIETEPKANLTFNEYMEMTDEEFIDYFDDIHLRTWDAATGYRSLSETDFGDDTIDDIIKFDRYFAAECGSQSLKENFNYNLWKKIANGKKFSIIIDVKEETPLDYDLTAADFGFPESWAIEALDCPGVLSVCSNDDTGKIEVIYGGDIHEYRIYPPNDIYCDFETFVRCDYSTRLAEPDLSEYGVTGIASPFEIKPGRAAPLRFGDTNIDGKVTIADSTAILQYLGNADKYPLTETALRNADCYNTGDGITGMDAVALQMVDAKIVDALPVAEY